MNSNAWLDRIRFGADGLVPVVAQDARSGNVLMLAYADREALERTVATGLAHYFSRSRGRLWRKGETTGHEQRVVELRLDCDADAVLYRVEQSGPACHTGTPTCFANRLLADGALVAEADAGGHPVERLAGTIARRAAERPAESYTVRLLARGVPSIAQKVGEEAVEVVVAATAEAPERLVEESADLLYHLLVLLRARGVELGRVWRELESRAK
ncbi:MAG TPA: bifunctional phosphoribosyl-AMP cyclohydrolase/phosphoribosyl-ATP diphosphatase HisIE [Gemmatimonadales bacterium]|nr:bifunctional phosphoribosyl-AMP cyclohydrolase/phosphoribosyl-ATP diphosphatase HisIE [Gemmatimonadales bacterium]